MLVSKRGRALYEIYPRTWASPRRRACGSPVLRNSWLSELIPFLPPHRSARFEGWGRDRSRGKNGRRTRVGPRLAVELGLLPTKGCSPRKGASTGAGILVESIRIRGDEGRQPTARAVLRAPPSSEPTEAGVLTSPRLRTGSLPSCRLPGAPPRSTLEAGSKGAPGGQGLRSRRGFLEDQLMYAPLR